MTEDELHFERWESPKPTGAAWRECTVVRRGDQDLVDVETTLTYTASSQLQGDVGRDLTEDEIRKAMRAYAEDEIRRRVAAGENLDASGFVQLEVESGDRRLLHPYLTSAE